MFAVVEREERARAWRKREGGSTGADRRVFGRFGIVDAPIRANEVRELEEVRGRGSVVAWSARFELQRVSAFARFVFFRRRGRTIREYCAVRSTTLRRNRDLRSPSAMFAKLLLHFVLASVASLSESWSVVRTIRGEYGRALERSGR